ncbi:MAG: 7TM diverse intracellular signaling domain-containing protein [Campylobacterota bacterium]|nr:7TM diverse intracellular signaling domain-containing protein [Campylobacterota bacterium]
MSRYKLILFLFLTTIIYAKPIIVQSTLKVDEILSSSKVYVDETNTVTLKDIEENKVAFKNNNDKRLSYGYSPNFNIWIKFTLQNNTDKIITKILEYNNPLTTHIELFDLENKLSYKDGILQINKDRNSLTPIFNIVLNPHETKTYYLKASSYITTLIIELKLWEVDRFYNKELKYQSILQLFFGAMLILAVYNMFIYFFSLDKSYFYYVLYILGVVIHQLMYTGVAHTYLIKQQWLIYSVEYAVLVIMIPVLTLAFFSKAFLKLSQYKKHNRILNILIFITIAVTPLFLVTDMYNNYRNIPSIILAIFLIYITIYALIDKNRQAYFIITGWSIIFFAVIVMYLSSLGVFPIFKVFPYFIESAFLLEALLFSVALADKINHLQIERDNINQTLITQQETEKDRLSIEVKNKTEELQEAVHQQTTLLKELNHRVKNNMQTIISLVQLQAVEIEDKDTLDMFLTIQNRISAMRHLHELLYKQKDVSHINSFEYFDILVDALQCSYDKDVDITFNVKENLAVEPAIACGLILNELVTNSFKYAFSDDSIDAKIDIELYKVGDMYHLNIFDNGVGYNVKTSRTSFGLVLVTTFVKEHLKGTIVIDTTHGVSNKIVWRESE